MIILKLICLFLAIWMTIVNVGRLSNGNEIPYVNFLYQAIGIFGYIVLQFKLYN